MSRPTQGRLPAGDIRRPESQARTSCGGPGAAGQSHPWHSPGGMALARGSATGRPVARRQTPADCEQAGCRLRRPRMAATAPRWLSREPAANTSSNRTAPCAWRTWATRSASPCRCSARPRPPPSLLPEEPCGRPGQQRRQLRVALRERQPGERD